VPPPLLLSPDGTQIATAEYRNFDPAEPFSTSILNGGAMVPFVPGLPLGWIDNTRLLVNSYIYNGPAAYSYTGCTIYDLSGKATGTCALPELLGFQTVDSDTLYALNLPELVSISTGAVSWQSGDPLRCILTQQEYAIPSCSADAFAGSHVVLVSDSRLVVQSH
jgi:hypothetical protein